MEASDPGSVGSLPLEPGTVLSDRRECEGAMTSSATAQFLVDHPELSNERSRIRRGIVGDMEHDLTHRQAPLPRTAR